VCDREKKGDNSWHHRSDHFSEQEDVLKNTVCGYAALYFLLIYSRTVRFLLPGSFEIRGQDTLTEKREIETENETGERERERERAGERERERERERVSTL
jgi:hypothetical protein